MEQDLRTHLIEDRPQPHTRADRYPSDRAQTDFGGWSVVINKL